MASIVGRAAVAPSVTEQVASRAGTALLVALLILLLDPLQILLLMIVLGQGHFFATYYYQARAGKIGGSYLLAYAGVGLLLFGGFVLYPDFHLIVAVTSLYFVLHFVQDEKHLLGEKPSLQGGLDLLPILLCSAGFVVGLEPTALHAEGQIPYVTLVYPGALGDTTTRVAMLVGGSVLAANLGLVATGQLPFRASSLYFHAGSALLLALYVSGVAIPMEYLVGGVILLHYLNWYVQYYLKYRADPPRRTHYVVTILAINALVLALYFWTGRHPRAPFPVGILFLPGFFYLWTLMHLIFTTRRQDLGFWVPGRTSG